MLDANEPSSFAPGKKPAQPATRHWPAIGTDAAGNTVAEYAVLLAMVVGVALLGSRLLGGAAQGTFSSVLVAEAAEAGPQAPRSDAAPGKPEPTAEAATDGGWFSLRLLVAELIAVIALGGLWYVMHAARKRRELAGEDEVPANISRAIPHNRLFQKRQQIYRILGSDMRALFASRIQVRHVMSERVVRVQPETSADEVRQKMKAKQFRHLLVCHGDGKVLGIISDRDVAERVGTTAGALMTKDPLTVPPTTLLNPAVTLMIENRISCLPVMDGEGHLVGVLTSTDLMMTLQCALQLLHRLASEVAGPDPAAAADDLSDAAGSEPPCDREEVYENATKRT